jgi:hypothetical protein
MIEPGHDQSTHGRDVPPLGLVQFGPEQLFKLVHPHQPVHEPGAVRLHGDAGRPADGRLFIDPSYEDAHQVPEGDDPGNAPYLSTTTARERPAFRMSSSRLSAARLSGTVTPRTARASLPPPRS